MSESFGAARYRTLVRQFVIGLLVNLACVAVLLCTSYDSLQIGGVDSSRNHWWADDRAGYIRPARSFLVSGEFHRMGVPDYHRTIGYPLFLAGMMAVGGDDWAILTYLVQALLLAFVYPALSVMGWILFPGRRLEWPVFAFSLLSACYFPYGAQLLTDGLFTAFFVVGVCFGLLAVERRSVGWLLAQCVAIGFAAQVRPVLVAYPLTNAVLLACVVWRNPERSRDFLRWRIMVFSTLVLGVVCSAPSIRNYMNHRVFVPTDVLSNNLATYLAQQVMNAQGRKDEYAKMNAVWREMCLSGRLKERLESQDRFAWRVYRDYPLFTMAIYSYNAFWNLFEMHWQNILYFHRMSWLSDDMLGRFQRSPSAFLLAMPWIVIYALVYILFASFLVRCFRQGDWVGLAALLLFVAPLLATFIAGEGARMRLPFEGLIVLCAAAELHRILAVYRLGLLSESERRRGSAAPGSGKILAAPAGPGE